MNALRHRRFAWLHLAIALWLGVFSSYALAMQASMQVGMALAAVQQSEQMPCPEHHAASEAAESIAAAPHHSNGAHDCPICHVIGSGWVQTPAAITTPIAALSIVPRGHLFQAIEYLSPADSPPPNS